jgi:hypothetical protein
MLAGLQAGLCLRGVHLGRRAQDDRVHFLQRQAVRQLGGDVANAVLRRHLLGLVQFAADQGHDFNTVNIFDAVQVFDAKGTGAR